MTERHNAERIRALEGCARLYQFAAEHLKDEKPKYEEAARIIRTAIVTAEEIQQSIIMEYIMSGDFQKHMFEGLQERLDNAYGEDGEMVREFFNGTIPDGETK